MSLGCVLRRSVRIVFLGCVLAGAPRVSFAQPPPPEPPPATQPPAAQQPPPADAPPAAKSPEDGVQFVGAGDIANCEVSNGSGARATAALLARFPEAIIFTTGDHAYQTGSEKDFKNCYDATWGRYKARTHPAAGNHDLLTDKGKPYWDYFGDAAGPRGLGYYTYEVGAWHVVVLNSAIPARKGSDQYKWLMDDLTAHKSTDCVLAIWHIARFSSGAHGSDPLMDDMWRALADAGADVVLSSHDHDYERFAPMDGKGKPDPQGVREFVIGTGGGGVYDFKSKAPNSEVRDRSAYGVLKMTLKPKSYDWEFVPMTGMTFKDSGSGSCSPAKP